MPILLNIFLSLIFCLSAYAGQSYDLEKIVVKAKGPVGQGELSAAGYPAEILDAQDLKEKNLLSVADSLDYVGGMDLRSRSAFGVQADLSLRGSGYEQVAVLIDGLNVMDPQTGHHNLDIPLTAFDLEKVEVTKTGVSSRYGAGALAGSVNLVTSKPSKKSLELESFFGEHALSAEAFSLSLADKGLQGRFSYDHKLSKSARPNTDFEYKTATLYLNKDLAQGTIDALCGYQKKDFGADSFYSNLFPEEEEHTQTLFFKTGLTQNLDKVSARADLYLRKHRDKFILRRNNPTSVNYHTTYVYGLSSQFKLPLSYGDILLGADVANDEINSTNLGKHARFHQAGSLGFNAAINERMDADISFRVDNYQKWGQEPSYNLGAGYFIIKDALKVKASASGAFRLPSFTELYYSDAANKGNPELKRENSDTFSCGVNLLGKQWEGTLDFFYRRGENLIDWTRQAATDPWQATNLGRVDFRGIEFSAKIEPGWRCRSFTFAKAAFSYNYTDADKKTSGFLSKYALDILQHQYILDIYTVFCGLNFNWQLSYSQRYYGETYFIGNIYLGKRLKIRDYSFEPFVRIDNFSNAKYSEVAGVLQPARWIKSGFKFEW